MKFSSYIIFNLKNRYTTKPFLFHIFTLVYLNTALWLQKHLQSKFAFPHISILCTYNRHSLTVRVFEHPQNYIKTKIHSVVVAIFHPRTFQVLKPRGYFAACNWIRHSCERRKRKLRRAWRFIASWNPFHRIVRRYASRCLFGIIGVALCMRSCVHGAT